MQRQEILNRILEQGAVAVIRMSDSERLLKVADAVREGGLSAIEITMTTPNALHVLEECSNTLGDEIILGVGSVLDAETACSAIRAGARYVVSPILKADIIREAHRQDVPAMPGTFTPTEMQLAHENGADIIKVFPADVLGMAFFKAVKAPMPHLTLMPTGGVSLTNAGDWLRAGASAVGVGSALLDKEAIAEGNYVLLTQNAKTLMESIASGRQTPS